MAGDSVYDSRSVANYMINKSAQHGGLDPLQVLKLIYIAHGFTLAAYDRPLLDDDVEAWKYGPVVRRVYSMLPAGAARITASIPGVAPAVLDDQSRSVVDTVYDKYHPLSGLYLSTLTHKQGEWSL
jgi:uncharacterized phage-associated protein